MNKHRKMVFISLLVAQAMILSFIERMIPVSFAMPGAKLGLANIITLVSLYLFGFKEALFIVFLRTFLTDALFGSVARFLYSISGGLLSLFAMYLIMKIGKDKVSTMGISIVGAVFHSIGQVLVAALVIQNIKIVMYLPYLTIVSVGTGLFVGITVKYLLSALRKLKYFR